MRQINEIYLPRFRETLECAVRQSKHLRYSLAQVAASDQWDLGDKDIGGSGPTTDDWNRPPKGG